MKKKLPKMSGRRSKSIQIDSANAWGHVWITLDATNSYCTSLKLGKEPKEGLRSFLFDLNKAAVDNLLNPSADLDRKYALASGMAKPLTQYYKKIATGQVFTRENEEKLLTKIVTYSLPHDWKEINIKEVLRKLHVTKNNFDADNYPQRVAYQKIGSAFGIGNHKYVMELINKKLHLNFGYGSGLNYLDGIQTLLVEAVFSREAVNKVMKILRAERKGREFCHEVYARRYFDSNYLYSRQKI